MIGIGGCRAVLTRRAVLFVTKGRKLPKLTKGQATLADGHECVAFVCFVAFTSFVV
jgi:hypothetical protein